MKNHFCQHFLFATVTCLVSAVLATPAHAETTKDLPSASEKSHVPDTVFYVGAGGGSLAQEKRAYFGNSLLLTRPLGRFTALELMVASGYAPHESSGDSDMWGRLALGLRVEDGLARLRPYASLRATHIHMASKSTWASYPLQSVAGDSEHGLGHRSGMSLASGVTWAPEKDLPIRLGIGAELMWVPIGHGPRWFPELEATVGYTF